MATTLEAFTAKILAAAAKQDTHRIEDLAEALFEAARADGMQDLLIDLVDADEISEEGVAFARENNGVKLPRR